MDYINIKKRKYLDEKSFSDYEYNNVIENFNNLNINNVNSDDILKTLIKKIDNLDKKIENLTKLNIKFDTLHKNIDTILVEKDYIIDNLKDEINNLKSEIKESFINMNSQRSINSNDYFY
jgi:hypothetical protein